MMSSFGLYTAKYYQHLEIEAECAFAYLVNF